MMLRYHLRRAIRALAFACLLPAVACESDSSGPKSPAEPGVVELDASSSTVFTYFRLSDGAVVAVPNPTASDDWDIAVRRFAVKLNGGVAGPKGVLGYNLKNNATATDDQVLGFTATNQLAAFEAVGPADVPDTADFEEEGLGPDFSTWFRFDPVSNGLVANPAAAWKIRRSGGTSYGLIRVTRIVASSTALDSLTFEYRLQSGNTIGAASEITIPTTGNNAVNLGSGSAVAATGCGWDVSAGADFSISVNAACDVGTFPLDATENFPSLAAADDASTYGPFFSLISGPIPNSTSDRTAPFLYDLAGDNRLSPTFTTYLVKVASRVYKLQLINYYGQSGASGHPTLRFAPVE
jgi:hypothetical protein